MQQPFGISDTCPSGSTNGFEEIGVWAALSSAAFPATGLSGLRGGIHVYALTMSFRSKTDETREIALETPRNVSSLVDALRC
jgi:hypothetical protein